MACSEPDSTAAASARTCSDCQPSATVTAVTARCPVVRVPVLSNTTVSTLRMASRARYPLRKMPSCAPRPEATIIAVGVARPSAQGHAITSTASAAEKALSAPPPASSHPAAVRAAITNTAGTNTPEIRSARRWASAFCDWASSTRRTIAAKWVSEPTAAASTIRRPSSTMVPPTTLAPGCTPTGLDSPVMALISTAALPSTTRPSAAMVSPGRTTKRCCSLSCSAGMTISVPSAWSTVTFLALSAASARNALPAFDLARASKYRPASTNTVTPAATSR